MVDVLVLDDVSEIAELVSDVLEQDGIHARVLTCPYRAIEVAREPNGCSLLITDIDLGVVGLNGFGVARHLREHRPGLGVVFISGRDWNLDDHDCYPGDVLLKKPFRQSQILAAVRQRLFRTSR